MISGFEDDFSIEGNDLALKDAGRISSLLRGYHILCHCADKAAIQNHNDATRFQEIKRANENRLHALVDILLRNGYTPISICDLLGANISLTPSLREIIGANLVPMKRRLSHDTHQIVLIFGFSCSGKDTVALLLKEKLKARLLNFSDLIKDVLSVRRILNPTRDDYIETGNMLRDIFGKDILASAIMSLLQEEPGNVVCVGPRFLEEVKVFQREYVIGVRVDPQDPEDNLLRRFQRYVNRSKSDPLPTFDDFLSSHLKEREGIQEIIDCGLVGHWIINDKQNISFHNLHQQVEALLLHWHRGIPYSGSGLGKRTMD